MSKAISTFILSALLAAVLTALSLSLVKYGHSFGATGVERLDSIATPTGFIALAAIYFLAAALMMILPIRAAGFVFANAADTIFWATIMLFAAIVGYLLTRWAFGQTNSIWALLNWRFLFAAAIVLCHFGMNEFRRNALTRSLFFVVFIASTLACLFWSFRF